MKKQAGEAAKGAKGKGGYAFAPSFGFNVKLRVCEGIPAWRLDVDGVAHASSEALDAPALGAALVRAAGAGLLAECETVSGCRPGEARLTSGHSLRCRALLHTVGPRYAQKFRTAAENTLSHCYRACLEAACDAGLRTVALPCLYSEGKGYPREAAAHVAARTVRRFMESHAGLLDAVVLCVSGSDVATYTQRVLPLYFPRDAAEAEAAAPLLPRDLGNATGECALPERDITISAGPTRSGSSAAMGSAAREEGRSPVDALAAERETASDSENEDEASSAFMPFSEDPDRRRVQARSSREDAAVERGEAAAVALLGRARRARLDDVAAMRIFSRAGRDGARRIVSCVAAHYLPAAADDLNDRLMLLVAREAAALAGEGDFTAVYFHADASGGPGMRWVRNAHDAAVQAARDHLKVLYVVHPTTMLKASLWWASAWAAEGSAWSKVVYVDSLAELFHLVPREQLSVPEHVVQHDQRLNGAPESEGAAGGRQGTATL